MTQLEQALVRLEDDARGLGVGWAVIGGFAISVRAEPRTTRDIDLVVAVDDDRHAERVVRGFLARGYRLLAPLEQEDTGRLATVRLIAPGGDPADPVIVDLLFASSGIEPEIVAAAEPLDLPPGVRAPIAKTGHLLALKALAARLQDLADLEKLIRYAEPDDLRLAREAVALIRERGFHRGRDVEAVLEGAIAKGRSE